MLRPECGRHEDFDEYVREAPATGEAFSSTLEDLQVWEDLTDLCCCAPEAEAPLQRQRSHALSGTCDALHVWEDNCMMCN